MQYCIICIHNINSYILSAGVQFTENRRNPKIGDRDGTFSEASGLPMTKELELDSGLLTSSMSIPTNPPFVPAPPRPQHTDSIRPIDFT